jgi:hypothetical protein
VFCFNLELSLAGFTHPMVLAFNERVIVDAFATIGRADVTLHMNIGGKIEAS